MRLLAATLLTLTVAAGASAASTPKQPATLSPEAEKKHADYFKRGDTNADGAISKEEYTAKALKRFDETDANHDGKLSPQEVKTYREAKKTERAKRKAARKAAKAAEKVQAAPPPAASSVTK